MILDGKIASKAIKENIKKEIDELCIKYNKKPSLVVIQIGDNPASNAYVKGKIKDCLEVGINSFKIHFEETITEDELISKIKDLNSDDSIDGILVQLPLPKHINEEKVIKFIDPKKMLMDFILII
jgi:methylenetetrahydrofolate dehydrogenase (NADP+)/methenyltetrahydrofolate cyclohydrolase